MALDITTTEILTNKTAAASSSTNIADCTAVDLSQAVGLAIGVKLTFNASATLGATVKVYSITDGTNYSTDPVFSWNIPVSAGNTVYDSRTLVRKEEKIKVVVTNLDTGYSITAIYVYSHVQA